MLEGYRENEPLRLEIPDKPGRRALRLDPALDFCMVRVASLLLDGKPYRMQWQAAFGRYHCICHR